MKWCEHEDSRVTCYSDVSFRNKLGGDYVFKKLNHGVTIMLLKTSLQASRELDTLGIFS